MVQYGIIIYIKCLDTADYYPQCGRRSDGYTSTINDDLKSIVTRLTNKAVSPGQMDLPTNDNKSANALALCHPPSASFCSVLAGQWSSRIFTHDRYNILSDILIEFEVNLGIIIEKYAKT